MNLSSRLLVALLLVIVLAPRAYGTEPRWMFRTNLVGVTQSALSEPFGYESALRAHGTAAFDVALRRSLGAAWAGEIIGGLYSQDIGYARNGIVDIHGSLGSLQVVPVTLLLQWLPRASGRVHPYAGAGANISTMVDRTGSFGSLTKATRSTMGAALQIGSDFDLSPALLFDVEIGWHVSRYRLSYQGAIDADAGQFHDTAHLRLDPFTIGAGIGVRF